MDQYGGCGMADKATEVLVVDDSMLARMMLSTMIGQLRAAWTIHQYPSARAALAALDGIAPDYATIDFNMPEMDGLTLAQHLLERRPAMKIALVTANIQDSIRQKAEGLGLTFLPKPISEPKVEALLAEWGA